MKAIVFGANGQDGFYLMDLLKHQNINAIGISRNGDFLKTDITNFNDVANLIKTYQPQFIFHLAANSTTQHSALFENQQTIVTGSVNIFEAVKQYSPTTKIFISGSGLQFINNNLPIKETDDFEARDAYSASRIQSVYLARYYQRLGLKIYIGYFFNHDSPRRTERHMAMKIAAASKRIANGSNEKLEIGDINAVKEWTYAGDIVEGIWKFVNQDNFQEMNISSGIGFSIEEWTDLCFNLLGKNYKDYVVVKSDFIPEYKQLISDASKLYSIGWKPQVDLKTLAKMMIA